MNPSAADSPTCRRLAQRQPRRADIFPCFQPIVEVASGRISSYEALARKRNRKGTIRSAGEMFTDPTLNFASKRRLDHQLRRQALQCAHLLPADTRLTLNISPEWIDALKDDELIPTLEMIATTGVDPRRLIIEITELNGNIDRLLAVVNRYRACGLLIAVDDFGAGFSQMDRVIALQPDIIKLDMQLFKQATEGGYAEQIVELLVKLSVKSGAGIVCEGVETREEFNFGLKWGAHFMQGHLFAAAETGFQPVDSFIPKVSRLRRDFFDQMRQQENAKISSIQRVKHELFALRSLLRLQPGVDLDRLQRRGSDCSTLIRFYICNREGDQISASYNFQPERRTWQCDESPIGYNWSWRPYFYQLAAVDAAGGDRLVASKRYQDLASGRPCRTLATLLDDQRVLLVDVVADEQ